ncbi:hypothetical protein D3C83_22990 [compost metagenome]
MARGALHDVARGHFEILAAIPALIVRKQDQHHGELRRDHADHPALRFSLRSPRPKHACDDNGRQRVQGQQVAHRALRRQPVRQIVEEHNGSQDARMRSMVVHHIPLSPEMVDRHERQRSEP